jgi:putative Mg2+ transporter-C (MgtC) family protein
VEITSPLHLWELVGRLALAVVLGAAVGFDREVHNKPAGFRTHAMVGLGSALMCAISLGFPGPVTHDSEMVSRVLQGLIAGIGFVGGGAILRRENQQDVTGLTTATSIWVVAAIGASTGLGLWQPALLTAVFALAILSGGSIMAAMWARLRHSRGGPPSTDA